MQQIKVIVENLKCGGCANSIKKQLFGINGVVDVIIEKEISEVKVIHNGQVERTKVVNKLKTIGYPELGTVLGVESIITNAKSFASCAVGRVGNL